MSDKKLKIHNCGHKTLFRGAMMLLGIPFPKYILNKMGN
jgi:hypothetical protein